MADETLAKDGARTRTEVERPQRQTRAPLIVLGGVEKAYRMGKVEYRARRGVDLSITVGASWSGSRRRSTTDRRSGVVDG
jgi:hypothetical protein